MLSTFNVRLAAIPVSALLALSAAGCGDDSEAEPQRPATDSAAAAHASASASTAPATDSEYDTTLEIAEPTVSPAALDKYGATEVDEAASLVANIVDEYGYSDTLVLSKRGDNVDYILAITEKMTPSAAQEWRDAITDFDPPATGPGVVNKEVRSIKVSLASDGRLRLRVAMAGDIRLAMKQAPSAAEKHQLLPFNRDITFWMVQSDGTWKIDAWRSKWKAGTLRAER